MAVEQGNYGLPPMNGYVASSTVEVEPSISKVSPIAKCHIEVSYYHTWSRTTMTTHLEDDFENATDEQIAARISSLAAKDLTTIKIIGKIEEGQEVSREPLIKNGKLGQLVTTHVHRGWTVLENNLPIKTEFIPD